MLYTVTETNRKGDRKYNQDRIAVLDNADSILLVLGDGIGGKKGGDLAAQCLIDTVSGIFMESTMPIDDPPRYLTNILRVSHNAVVTMGNNEKPPIDPGTTAVLCLIQNDKAYWAHAGDSRFYLFRGGLSIYRTIDHSYVEELYQKGKLSMDKRQGHPMRGYITQCIGHMTEMPKIDVSKEVSLIRGDILLLCSDGLWEPLDDALIGEVITGMEIDRALNKLADTAIQTSKPHADNTTAIAMRINELSKNLQAEQDELNNNNPEHEKIKDLNLAIRNIEEILEEYKHDID